MVATDNSGAGNAASAPHVVTITITGTNDQPALTIAKDAGHVTEGNGTATLTDSGALSFADLDTNDLVTVSQTYNNDIVWSGGTLSASLKAALIAGFSVDQDSWDYCTNQSLDFLRQGETITLSFNVVATDNSGAGNAASAPHVVTITITGTNDQPALTVAKDAGHVTEGNGTPTLTDSGVLSFADLDTNDLVTVSQTYNNDIVWSGGTLSASLKAALIAGFSVDQDSWDYSTNANLDFLGAGETITLSFNVVATDDSGAGNAASAPHVVTITITGTNDQTVLTSVNSTGAVTSVPELTDASAQNIAPISGSLAFSDKDIGDNLSASAGTPTIELNGGSLPAGVDAAALAAALNHLNFGAGVVSNGGGTQNITWTWDPTATNLDFLKTGDQLTVTYAVQVGDSASQNLTFTITGTNDQTVLTSVNSTGAVTSVPELTDASAQNIAPISGSLAFSDKDIGDNLSASAGTPTIKLNGGSLPAGVDAAALAAALNHLNFGAGVVSNGGGTQNITWTWDPTATNLDFLKTGDQLTVTYAVQVGDSASQNLTFTITGTNDQTVLTSVNSTGAVTSVPELTDASAQNIAPISGSLAFSDKDIGDNLSASAGTPTIKLNGGSLPAGVDAAALAAALNHLNFGAGVVSNGGGTQNITWTWDPTADESRLPQDGRPAHRHVCGPGRRLRFSKPHLHHHWHR